MDTFPEGAENTKFTKIYAGKNYTYALNDADASNELYSWGLGQQYVLGSREEETQFKPVLVNPKMFKFSKVR